MAFGDGILDSGFLLQLAVVGVTVILSVWGTQSRMKARVTAVEVAQKDLNEKIIKEIGRLADQVEKQNGYVRQHGENISNLSGRMEITEKLIDALIKRESDREIGRERQP